MKKLKSFRPSSLRVYVRNRVECSGFQQILSMHKIINSIIYLRWLFLTGLFWRPCERVKLFSLSSKNDMMGAYGMNYGRHGGVEISGEAAALNYVKSRLNFPKNG
ncbi:MAG: hypothetical protein HC888_08525 [Candidatus Competibacteraceae bacterium]|nr:hypothetical protein [Candidatus Competibacteraceae bacterium]